MTALHVVVAGHGMVGARFAEEVRRLDPRGRRVRLTILGAESCPAYNRVLLPSLLSGAMTEADLVPAPPAAPAAGVRAGAAVAAIDPAARTVLVRAAGLPAGITGDAGTGESGPGGRKAGDGKAERLRYGALVLATGGRPVLVPLPGVLAAAGNAADDGGAPVRSGSRLAADVAVLHSLADARRIAALAQAARRRGGRIAVLGGGVLGIEAARALAERGTAVTVVHRGSRLMERQLDAPAGRVLAAALRRTGVAVELAAAAARWEPGRGLRLADGRLIAASGLVLCAGMAPRAELAGAAGLRLTGTGAVAVDDALATSAPGVYAIGDCAGHPGTAGGLVQPGWEQAAVLAARLTGTAPGARYRGSAAVTRLKAAGIELTSVGSAQAEPDDSPGVEVIRFEDPARERYAKLVLAAGRVAGAIMIGLPDAAARIVQLYDRGAPAPADRLALLLGRALPPERGGASGPGALPDHAVICRCNMVTRGQLRDAWHAGARTRPALSAATRAATGCGTCAGDLDAVAGWLARHDRGRAGAAPPGAAPAPAAGQAAGQAAGLTADSAREAALR